jgi:glucose-6-phosphate isomerase
MQYAAARNILLEKGKALELLVSYEPSFTQMAEWWKQLFGESEGKDGKGIFPCSAIFSMDLHSLGQFVQDGTRNLFETVVRFKKSQRKFVVAEDEENGDGLNFLAGMDMQEINEKARLGTLVAHTEGGVPNIVITCEKRTPAEVGKLIYFFEIACAVSGYMLGVNPFNQPGVESYKKNMFALLGKPGYEDMKAAIEAKLD